MYDLIIIGAGPAGLAAAIYARRAGLDVLVLEQNSVSGGQVLNTYEVDNYPGIPGVTGPELAQAFRGHAERLSVAFRTAKVKSLTREGGGFHVEIRKEMLEARTVIFAAGTSHAKLGVLGESDFAGHGVSYCATCDGAFYQGKTAAVVGGGNTALEDAIYLARICSRVYLIHRRDELRGSRALQDELRSLSNVEILYSHTVEEIRGRELLESVLLCGQKTGEKKELAVDGLFIAVGITPDSGLVQGLAECDERGFVAAGEDGVTSCPGLFVAGDVRTKPLRQIITAASDGANAAVSAKQYLAKCNKCNN